MKVARRVAGTLGRGLLAGLAGTAAMTIASTIEMKLRRRPASKTPAKAAERVLHVQPRDEEGARKLSNVVHWTYGTAWGLARALVGELTNRHVAAPALHFALVWGSSLVMLPSLDLAPPITRWSRDEIATDVLHHVVYVTAADAAYRALGR
jgi:hypothetical protein